jgi:peptide/nickel transport system ATP-binding protein
VDSRNQLKDVLLEVKDLEVSFDTFEGTSNVVDKVSFSVGDGEVVSLVGETGCGKSVTLKTILGILPSPPARISGEIGLMRKNILSMSDYEASRYRKREIAIIPQSVMSSLNPTFTIKSQFCSVILYKEKAEPHWGQFLFGRSVSRSERRDAEASAMKLLSDVMIPSPEKILNSYPFELSGGMRQRVLIAMALSGDPSLLLADEPGTALDVTTFSVILDLLRQKISERGLSVIYVTHNLAVASAISQRINIMYAGNIVESASASAIFKDPKHPYTVGLLEAIPKLTAGGRISGIPGNVPEYLRPPAGCRFHPRCPYAMDICRVKKPVLTDTQDGHLVACHLYY